VEASQDLCFRAGIPTLETGNEIGQSRASRWFDRKCTGNADLSVVMPVLTVRDLTIEWGTLKKHKELKALRRFHYDAWRMVGSVSGSITIFMSCR